MSIVLFSPVGGTDPLSNVNYQDGAILHIVRNYRPNRIVLFMSKEILQYHREDNRYIKSLNLLYEQIQKNEGSYLRGREKQVIQKNEECLKPLERKCRNEAVLEYYQIGDLKVELIERESLSEVQDFNTFYKEFPEWIHYVMETLGQEDQLLFNVSSGTPAMKGCLLSMQLLQDLRCTAIQVFTPEKKMNEHSHHGFSLEEAWENNIDNLEEFENRCTEVLLPDFARLIQENQIIRLIKEYDYKGALTLAEALPRERSARYLPFLKMALQRSLLDIESVEKFIQNNKGLFQFPLNKGGKKEEKAFLVFEYCLQMQLKLSRGDYDGFIRSLTPVIWDLFFQIIEKDLQLPISNYLNHLHSKKKPQTWKVEVLRNGNTIQEQKIFKALTSGAVSLDARRATVYSTHLLALIQAYHSAENVKEIAGELRKVEEELRNIVAHQMISVTNQSILDATGFTPKIIMDKIKQLYAQAYLHCSEEKWKSYEYMNEEIIQVLSLGGKNFS